MNDAVVVLCILRNADEKVCSKKAARLFLLPSIRILFAGGVPEHLGERYMGHRKRMADGKVNLPYSQFLGYEKGKDGLLKIVEAEAEIVRLIYRLFMEGMTPSAIANDLMRQDIPSPSGKALWYPSTVKSILSNEKYKGDALLQKKFTEDFLTKRMIVNKGQVSQFYVENSHPYSTGRV